MSSSSQTTNVAATDVRVAEDHLEVDLSDGRSVSVPISWYPRLSHARRSDLEHWVLIGNGFGVHWPELDEDISVTNILSGQRSAESARSFQKWKDTYLSKR